LISPIFLPAESLTTIFDELLQTRVLAFGKDFRRIGDVFGNTVFENIVFEVCSKDTVSNTAVD
jgi:hypothetical protein